VRHNANSVIHLAYNTAAPDVAHGAAGFSDPARDSFQAGARTLFVSNWSAGSDAAAGPTAGMLDGLAGPDLRPRRVAAPIHAGADDGQHGTSLRPPRVVGAVHLDWRRREPDSEQVVVTGWLMPARLSDAVLPELPAADPSQTGTSCRGFGFRRGERLR
jgi:hypothetical protein